jgi:hypothetical protein
METINEVNCFVRQIYIKNALFYLYLFSQSQPTDIIKQFLKEEIEGVRG